VRRKQRPRHADVPKKSEFGQLPPDAELASEDVAGGNEPMVDIPDEPESPPVDPNYAEPANPPMDDASNAPGVVVEEPSDLEAVREELKRRNDE
jgi:hypothetical protein